MAARGGCVGGGAIESCAWRLMRAAAGATADGPRGARRTAALLCQIATCREWRGPW